MILGRTPEGAIKTKTDGGLRAVNCACCEPLVCGCSPMSAAVKTVIASATQVTVNGNSQAWNGSNASYLQLPPTLSWYITYNAGILCFLGDNGDNTVKLLPEPLTIPECEGFPFSSTETITIQGEAYRSLNFFSIPLPVTISFS
jgi:hypothetical protein